MVDRVIAEILFWGLRGGIAWFVAHETGLIAAEKLNEVARPRPHVGHTGHDPEKSAPVFGKRSCAEKNAPLSVALIHQSSILRG
jgi:hypothetical protein